MAFDAKIFLDQYRFFKGGEPVPMQNLKANWWISEISWSKLYLDDTIFNEFRIGGVLIAEVLILKYKPVFLLQ